MGKKIIIKKNSVLYCCYNRPNLVIKSIKHLDNKHVKKIYIFRDGPKNNLDDKINCNKVAEIIKNYKFDCNVSYKLNKHNLGCKLGMQSALSWFFKKEKQGIILEDDMIPSKNFFKFSNYCLEKYRDNKKIMMISGTNYVGSGKSSNEYYYSEQFLIWGWATWRSAWKKYDPKMRLWKKNNVKTEIKNRFSPSEYSFLKKKFDSLYTTYKDTWDIQWYFSCIYNKGLTIMPKANLISNIGKEGTHDGLYTKTLFLKLGSINLKKIICPKKITANRHLDLQTHNKFNVDNFFQRLYNFLLIKPIYKILLILK